jgi:putative acetyltransferase
MPTAMLPTTSMQVRAPVTPREWEEAAAILHDHAEWIRAAAGFEPFVEQPAFATEIERLTDHYDGRDAELFLALDGELAIGTVAVRFGDGRAELKRMYVRPVARGRGAADLLVEAVVATAARRGCRLVWLETLRGVMDRAIAGLVERPAVCVSADHRLRDVS